MKGKKTNWQKFHFCQCSKSFQSLNIEFFPKQFLLCTIIRRWFKTQEIQLVHDPHELLLFLCLLNFSYPEITNSSPFLSAIAFAKRRKSCNCSFAFVPGSLLFTIFACEAPKENTAHTSQVTTKKRQTLFSNCVLISISCQFSSGYKLHQLK